MVLRFPSEQLADLRHDAQLLVERTGDQEGQLETCVAAVEQDRREAEAAVSHAAGGLDLDEMRILLAAQEARVIAYTGNPSFDDSPTRALFSAVVKNPTTPDAVLAAVQHVAAL